MIKRILFLALLHIGTFSSAQETAEISNDSVSKGPKLTASVNVVYPYLWRGIRYYGDRVAFQPKLNYDFTDRISLELWATTNFSNASDAYNEFDWTIYYEVSPIVTLMLSDYYWPATSKNLEWERSSYFDFSEGSAQSLEMAALFDFKEKGIPFSFQWNTFIGGNDYKYDDEGNATSRAFSSYAEIGYSHTLKKSKIDIECFLGAVVINGGYYSNDTDENPGFQFNNFEIGATKEIKVNQNYSLPVFVKYVHNNYGVQEFDSEGNLSKTIRNFFACGLTLNIL